MTKPNDGGTEAAAEETTYTKAEVDQLLADAKSDQDEAVAAAQAEGAKAERERISAIVGLEEAKTRPALAAKLAFSDKGYTSEDAAEILQASAEETGGKGDMLAQAMAGKTPGVSSDGGDSEDVADAGAIDTNGIYAKRRQSTGRAA